MGQREHIRAKGARAKRALVPALGVRGGVARPHRSAPALPLPPWAVWPAGRDRVAVAAPTHRQCERLRRRASWVRAERSVCRCSRWAPTPRRCCSSASIPRGSSSDPAEPALKVSHPAFATLLSVLDELRAWPKGCAGVMQFIRSRRGVLLTFCACFGSRNSGAGIDHAPLGVHGLDDSGLVSLLEPWGLLAFSSFSYFLKAFLQYIKNGV